MSNKVLIRFRLDLVISNRLLVKYPKYSTGR